MVHGGVQTQHAKYKNRKKIRTKIRDCLGGSERVKSKGVLYLPVPNSQCHHTDEQYNSFVNSAYYLDLLSRTIRVLTGLVTSKRPNLNINPKLEYLIEDADGCNTSLYQMITNCIDEVASLGNCGLLTMQGATDSKVTKANQNKFLPKLRLYQEEQIINWRVENGKLTLVVLLEIEEVQSESNFFETDVKPNYRVFRINENGHLVEMLYKSKNINMYNFYSDDYLSGTYQLSNDFDVTETVYKERNEIPFTFIGAINNEVDLDPSPTQNITDLSLVIYQLSALEMLNIRNSAGGILTITSNLDGRSWQEYNGDSEIDIAFGALHLGQVGKAEYVQAKESQALGSSLERVTKYAVAQGAQIVTADRDKTATQSRIDQGANLSQLGQIAQNVEQAFTKHINLCARFINSEETNEITLNKEFFFDLMDANTMLAWSKLVMAGHASLDNMLTDMKKGGRIAESVDISELSEELKESLTIAGNIDVI